MISHFDRHNARIVSDRAEQALRTLEEELGVTFSVKAKGGNARSLSMEVTVSVGSEVEYASTPMGMAYKAIAPQLGLERDWLGQTFMFRGTLYRLVGAKTSRPKFPVEVERIADGQSFKMTPDIVRQGFAGRRLAS